MKRSTLGVLAFIVMLVACGPGDRVRDIELGALVYPVIGYDRATGACAGGLGTSGWNEPGGPITQAAPLAGYYCFGDSKYQVEAIDLMVDHGFSWALVSYNGWGDIALDGAVVAQDFRAAEIGIIDLMVRAQGKLEIALLVEPYVDLGGLDPANLSAEQRSKVLDHIFDRLYTPNASVVKHHDGKPLLVQWWPMDLGQDDRFTIRTFGSSIDPDFNELDWNWYPDLTQYPGLISDDGFVSFAPRFVDPFDGRVMEGQYDQFWDMALENRDRLRLVLVYSWNAWGEEAGIEPTRNSGLDLLRQTQEGFARLLE